MSDTFSVGLVQCRAGRGYDEARREAAEGVREAARLGAQVICLQELFCGPYFCSTEEAANCALAEAVDGPAVSGMSALAAQLGVSIVVPFFEKRAPGVYHNSAAVVDADGSLLGVYRKMHIPDDPLYYEKFYFTPGDAHGEHCGYRIFRTRFADIGVLICWDQWYPEPARITAMLGAEVLFYPTAIGWHPFEKETHGEAQWSAWHTMQRSHAIANGVYVAAVNRVGHEETPGTEGIQFFGRSFLSDPFGNVLAQASSSEPQVLVQRCSRTIAEETRRMWPFFRDRRVDSYSPILNRWIGDKK